MTQYAGKRPGKGADELCSVSLKTPKEIRGYRNLGKKSYDELIGKLEQVLEKEVFEEWAKGI